jgi:predicted PurR-regulated permease PerM
MSDVFNSQLRQLFILCIILLIGTLLTTTLYTFLPGLMGSITLYILTKKKYLHLTVTKRWNAGFTAILFIILLLLLIAIPLYLSFQLVLPSVNYLLDHPKEIISGLELVSQKIEPYLGKALFTPGKASEITQNLTNYIPTLLSTTFNWITNLGMMFFFLFYLLYSNKSIDTYLRTIIPLNKVDYEQLSKETRVIIRANALGIPIISIIHGSVATLGYYLFGVENWALLGFATGIASFFPILGIMVVWVPMVLYYFAIDQTFIASAIALYSMIVTGNVDNIARYSIIKKLGNVHPMITVLGVIAGLKLFGFMGLIFGPLLISYFMILIKFYTKEFVTPTYGTKK